MAEITAAKDGILTEETSYKSAVSEFLLQKIGKVVNWSKTNAGQIGDIQCSMLTLVQFQAERDSTWVLCDGASAAGTDYNTVTGNANIPDFRGEFIRGLDNGRGVDAARTMGSSQAEDTGSHTHPQRINDAAGTGTRAWHVVSTTGAQTGGTIQNTALTETATFTTVRVNTDANTGAENRPRNVAANYFIKVNR